MGVLLGFVVGSQFVLIGMFWCVMDRLNLLSEQIALLRREHEQARLAGKFNKYEER